jgi:hypothetical protein
VASVRPRPTQESRRDAGSGFAARPWLWSAVAALVFLPFGYLAGTSTARVLPPPVMPAPAAVSIASAAAPATSYVVDLSVTPADAELWLDGKQVAVGHWRSELPRDAVAHQLRVTAAGHAPATLLFVDTPPPSELHLEALPVATSAPAVIPLAPATPAVLGIKPTTSEAFNDVLKARKRSVARAAVRRENPKLLPRARGKVLGTVLSVANPPQVQATERRDPTSRTLD